MAVKWFIKTVIGLILLGICLFFSAGRLDWPAAWVLIGISALNQVLVFALVTRVHADLLVERGRMQPGTKRWDRILAPLMAYSGVYICVVSGLDVRFSWTRSFPVWLQVVAGSIAIAGVALGIWAMVTNRFFSATVRIQTERGHMVVQEGPYRLIRHPGYLAAILFDLADPLLLGSWWGLVPGLVAIIVALVRTLKEDATLKAELAGYADYSRKVPFRLVPGVW